MVAHVKSFSLYHLDILRGYILSKDKRIYVTSQLYLDTVPPKIVVCGTQLLLKLAISLLSVTFDMKPLNMQGRKGSHHLPAAAQENWWKKAS